MSNPWDQLPGEPDRWYGRFQLYLDLGPARSVTRAYCRYRHIASATGAGDWGVRAIEWHWRERAHAWDAYQRDLPALSERNLRIGLRQSRIGITDEMVELIRAAIERAEIADAEREQARKWMPHLFDSLRGMLVEYHNRRATFLVCTGMDSELLLDLTTLKSVRAATGLQFQRALNPTGRSLQKALARQRGFGYPIERLHMGPQATMDGVELVDGVMDWDWLNQQVQGVQVLLLANCAGGGVASCVCGVPYVITLDERIAPADAAALVQGFWHGIGRGLEPQTALDEALAKCAPSTAALVTRSFQPA